MQSRQAGTINRINDVNSLLCTTHFRHPVNRRSRSSNQVIHSKRRDVNSGKSSHGLLLSSSISKTRSQKSRGGLMK